MTEQWDIAQNNKNIISYSNICHHEMVLLMTNFAIFWVLQDKYFS